MDTVEETKCEERLEGDGHTPVDARWDEGESEVNPVSVAFVSSCSEIGRGRNCDPPVGNCGSSSDHGGLDTDQESTVVRISVSHLSHRMASTQTHRL